MGRFAVGLTLCGFLSVLSGCGSGSATQPEGEAPLGSNEALSVVEVTTLTTVQSSAGIFLSPRPSQTLPSYVERGSTAVDVSFPDAASDRERAKVDLALLFRTADTTGARYELGATLASTDASSAPSIEHFFPAVSAETSGSRWPLVLGSSDTDSDGSSEWTGWQAYRGLAVRGQSAQAVGASAATLDFETLAARAPLSLSSDGTDLLVTNRSDHAISNALLIYSHPGGIGIRAIAQLAPGEQRVTTTGPKEGPSDQQLQAARQQLSDFFSQTLGADLGGAIAQAKSIPFLETQGLRLVYLLDGTQVPARVDFDGAVAEHRQIVISQGEVLLQSEEASVLSAVAATPSLDAALAPTLLGRFTQAKLEFAALNGDEQVRAESSQVLAELAAQ